MGRVGRGAMLLSLLATPACSPEAFEAIVRTPEAIVAVADVIDAASRPRGGGVPEASEAELAEIGWDHQERMAPLRDVSGHLLAGEAYWQRGTARFVVVVRSSQPGKAVLGLQVAESHEGSQVDVICAEAAGCADGSANLRVETMRWLRKNGLQQAERTRAVSLRDAELDWREPSVTLVRPGDVRDLRTLPNGSTPYAVALSSDASLALLRVHGPGGEQATIVRIPDRPTTL